MISVAGRHRGVPIASGTAWGMTYGVAFLALFAVLRGQTFAVEWTPAYLGGLFWLAIMSSVLAFAAYLRLLDRIGPARAGYRPCSTRSSPWRSRRSSRAMSGRDRHRRASSGDRRQPGDALEES